MKKILSILLLSSAFVVSQMEASDINGTGENSTTGQNSAVKTAVKTAKAASAVVQIAKQGIVAGGQISKPNSQPLMEHISIINADRTVPTSKKVHINKLKRAKLLNRSASEAQHLKPVVKEANAIVNSKLPVIYQQPGIVLE